MLYKKSIDNYFFDIYFILYLVGFKLFSVSKYE